MVINALPQGHGSDLSHKRDPLDPVLSALSATTLVVQQRNCIFLEEFVNTAPASVVVETVVEDLLEDVSIDGMCGVY